ncbi:MAG: D-xylose transport system substrate-binding protein [Actinomycetota bacterium]|nr:D-xylose transport system substrate-binding protein [Actinomycetota bacterium]
MRKRFVGAVALTAACSLALAGCGGGSSGGSSSPAAGEGSKAPAASGKVGVILPDSASSARWETADRQYLGEAFTSAGVEFDIQNAGGDKAKFQTLADGFISQGVKALMIVNLDSETGAAVVKKATAAGIPTIDYDRLTLGGGSAYYVSFDNVAVGTKIGEGLVKCLKDAGKTSGAVVELNGSPTDNNATLFKQGYHDAITKAGYTVADSQAVADWDNTKAVTVFQQMFTKLGGKFVGVAAANDGLGGSVISVLKQNGLAGKVPVTGQDATDEGLQRVLLGTQCMTVYKAIKKEAEAGAKLAIALAQGDKAGADALATGKTADSVSGKDVPSVLLEPQGIHKENVKDVISDGFTTKDKVCTTAELKAACTAAGIS